jgi:hypothetical protein
MIDMDSTDWARTEKSLEANSEKSAKLLTDELLKLTMVNHRIRCVRKTASMNLLVSSTLCALLLSYKAKCTVGQIIRLGDFDASSGMPSSEASSSAVPSSESSSSATPSESTSAAPSSESSSAIPSKSPHHSTSPSSIPSIRQVEFTSHEEWLDAIGGNDDSLMCIDFSDYALGTNITSQYANSSGITFTNGRYQVSRSAPFMNGYGLFSFQGEIHIQLHGAASATAIGVHLYQKYLRIRLLDDSGNQGYVSSELDHPQNFVGAVVPRDLAFSQVVLDCWNDCANEQVSSGCCRFLNMDRICFQSEYYYSSPTISASFTPSVMGASPSPTPKMSSPFLLPHVSSVPPTLVAPNSDPITVPIIEPNDSSSAQQRTLVHTLLLRLPLYWFLTFL